MHHDDREGTRHDEELPKDRGGSELPAAAFGEGADAADNAGGISNRPLDEEHGRQENLPPRGERREEWKED
jgi:hypothetical protein